MPKILSKQEFYDKYYPLVVKAIKETGSKVLPETAMAQLIAENGYREFDPNNPVFGVKAKGSEGGKVVSKKTKEVIDGVEKEVDANFRVYDTFDDAIKGYLGFLEKNPRYKQALQADSADEQLKGIADAGYATAPNYADSLATINKGNLEISKEYAEKTDSTERIPNDGVPYVDRSMDTNINGVDYQYVVMPNGDKVPMAMYGNDPRFKRIGNNLYYSTKKLSGNNQEREYVKIPTEKKEEYRNGYWPTEGDNFMVPLYKSRNQKSDKQVYNQELDYYASLENPTPEQKAQAKRLLTNAGRNLGVDSPEFKKFGVKYFDKVWMPQFEAESKEMLSTQQKIVDDIRDEMDDPNTSDARMAELSQKLKDETAILNKVIEGDKEIRADISKANEKMTEERNVPLSILKDLLPFGSLTDDVQQKVTKGLNQQYSEKKDIYDTWNGLSRDVLGKDNSVVTGDTSVDGITPDATTGGGTGGGNANGSVSIETDVNFDKGEYPDKVQNMDADTPDSVDPEGKKDGKDADYYDKKIGEIDEILGEIEQQPEFKADLSMLEAQDDKYGRLIGHAGDAARLIMGAEGAMEDTPVYEESGMFKTYANEAMQRRNMGLDPEEEAFRRQLAERAFGYDVKNIRRLTGGSAGVALGNLGRAAGSLQDRYAAIASEDSAVRRMNRQDFGRAAVQNEAVQRQKFEDKWRESMMTKQAGAKLVADSLKDMREREQFERQYGEGSIYNEYMKEGLIQKQQNRFYLDEGMKRRKAENKRELEKQKKEYQEKRDALLDEEDKQ